MFNNDQYPDDRHGTFTPVAVILVIAVCVLLAIFVFSRTQRSGPPDPSSTIDRGLIPSNPPNNPSN